MCYYYSEKHCKVMTVITAVVTVLILFLGGTFVHTSNDQNSQLTLELLHVVFRHGPRTPADTYPTDPHVNKTFYPFGWGHITHKGRVELFKIGSWLRKRYSSFLTPFYHPDMVHAQATGVARTHMTLQTVLASFFPPKNTPMEWKSRYNWQPIPIFSQPLNEDTLLLVRTPCPRYFEAFHEVMNSSGVKAEIEPHAYLFNELSEHTGMKILEPEDVQSIYLTLLAEQEFGLELPKWTKDYFPKKMQFLTEQSYIYNVYTPEMQKIKAGPFLKKMLTEMKQRRDGTLKPDKRKLFIYTGHDSTVVNILSALNIWKRQLPRYSVMAIFELRKNAETGEYFIQIYFRNNPEEPAEELTIPGCDFQCPLDKFIQLSEAVVPTEEDENRCESKNSAFIEPPLRGP